MMRVVREDERLGRKSWPPSRVVATPAVSRRACLIVCAGFEERTTGVLQALADSGSEGLRVIVMKYLPHNVQNRIDEVRELCRIGKMNVTELEYDRERPSGAARAVLANLRGADETVVDVSGMSRLLIVQLLTALLQEVACTVRVLYSEAMKYLPTEDTYRASSADAHDGVMLSYLSTGVVEVAATPELSSTAMAGEAIRLVAFPSFDPAQMANLVQELQPTYTDVIHGVPPREGNRWRTNAIRELNCAVLETLAQVRDHYVSTMDYRETLRLLTRIYDERNVFDRIVIAPTGSKMQAVAVGLLRTALQDVQIVYPVPQTFAAAEEYTVGVRRLHEIDIAWRRDE